MGEIEVALMTGQIQGASVAVIGLVCVYLVLWFNYELKNLIKRIRELENEKEIEKLQLEKEQLELDKELSDLKKKK